MRRTVSPVEIVPGDDHVRVHAPEPQLAALGRVDELERVAPEARGELRAPGVRLLRDLHDDRVADREPAPGRQALLVEAHVDEQVVARERPALRVGDEPEHVASTRS